MTQVGPPRLPSQPSMTQKFILESDSPPTVQGPGLHGGRQGAGVERVENVTTKGRRPCHPVSRSLRHAPRPAHCPPAADQMAHPSAQPGIRLLLQKSRFKNKQDADGCKQAEK